MLTLLGLFSIYCGSRGDEWSRPTRYWFGALIVAAESGLAGAALVYVTYMAAYLPGGGDRHLPFLPADWPRLPAFETFASHPWVWFAAVALYWPALAALVVVILRTAHRGTLADMLRSAAARYLRGSAYPER